jgi:hypothetical protein
MAEPPNNAPAFLVLSGFTSSPPPAPDATTPETFHLGCYDTENILYLIDSTGFFWKIAQFDPDVLARGRMLFLTSDDVMEDGAIEVNSNPELFKWPQTTDGVTPAASDVLYIRDDTSSQYSLSVTRAPVRLSSTASVNLNVTTKTTLYTVPTGKTLIVDHVVIRLASASLTTASFGVGFNANADDVVADATHTELTGNTLYTRLAPKVGAKIGAATDVFGLKCSIAQGAAATVTVDVFGWLY